MLRFRALSPPFWLLLAGSLAGASASAEREAAPVLTPTQGQQYQTVCARCHARTDTGAPVVGSAAAWQERVRPGFETLLSHTIDGFRTMPPLGTCGSCTEADFRALVSYVSGLADPGAAR